MELRTLAQKKNTRSLRETRLPFKLFLSCSSSVMASEMPVEYDNSHLHNYTAGMFAEQYSTVVRPADDTPKPSMPDWQPAHT